MQEKEKQKDSEIKEEEEEGKLSSKKEKIVTYGKPKEGTV